MNYLYYPVSLIVSYYYFIVENIDWIVKSLFVHPYNLTESTFFVRLLPQEYGIWLKDTVPEEFGDIRVAFVIIILIFFNYVTYLSICRDSSPLRKYRLMPGLWFFGSLFTVKNPNYILTKLSWALRHSADNTLRMNLGLRKTVLVTCNQSLIKALLKDNVTVKSKDYYSMFNFWCGSFFYSDSRALRRFRIHALRFTCVVPAIVKFLKMAKKQSEKLSARISRSIAHGDGEGTLTYSEISASILEITQAMVFGVLDASSRDRAKYANEVRFVHESAVSERYGYWSIFWPYIFTRDFFKRSYRRFYRRYFEPTPCLDKIENNTETRRLLPLEGMYFLNDIYGHLPKLEMMDFARYFELNAHEPISSAIWFTLQVIAWNEDIQRKLFDEQKRVYGDYFKRRVSMENVNALHYLQNVIVETLRIYPPVPIIYRKLQSDYTDSENRVIPKGTEVWIHLFALLRRNGKMFNGRNLSSRESQQPHPYTFGFGNSSCPGKKIAMSIIKIVLSKIVQKYIIMTDVEELDILTSMCSILQAETVLRTTQMHIPFRVIARKLPPQLTKQIKVRYVMGFLTLYYYELSEEE